MSAAAVVHRSYWASGIRCGTVTIIFIVPDWEKSSEPNKTYFIPDENCSAAKLNFAIAFLGFAIFREECKC